MADIEPSDILQALTILVTPAAKSSAASAASRLDSSFCNNTKKVCDYLKTLASSGKPIKQLLKFAQDTYSLDCYRDITSDENGECTSNMEESSRGVSQGGNSQDCVSGSDSGSVSETGNSQDCVSGGVEIDSQDIRWSYSKCNLLLLECLKMSMESAVKRSESTKKYGRQDAYSDHSAPILSPDALSFTQQKLVLTSVQFVACLGICPNLIPGVGIPVEQRSGLGDILRGSEPVKLSIAEREFRMWTCVSVLLDCVHQPSLGSLILSRHLSDILAALLQIHHAPRKFGTTASSPNIQQNQKLSECSKDKTIAGETSEMSDSVASGQIGAITTRQRQYTDTEREAMRSRVNDRLTELVTEVYQPQLIRELMLLQGGASPVHKQPVRRRAAPGWLCRACSTILSGCLLRASGVQNMLSVLLDTPAGIGKTVTFDWRRCEAAAKILSNSPTQEPNKAHFYRLISKQVVELLHCKDELVAGMYARVAVRTICELYSKDIRLTQEYILTPILSVCYRCLSEAPDVELVSVSETVVYVTEEALQRSIQGLHQLVVVASEPGSPLLSELDSILHFLFSLYVYCSSGVTILRGQVEDILTTYMKQLEVDSAVVRLKQVVTETGDTRIRRMNHQLMFVAAPAGAVAIVLTPTGRPPVMDDWWESVSTAIVTLLKRTSSEDLSAKYFLTNLQELSSIIMTEVEDVDEPTHSEYEVIQRLQHNLTVLGILSNMSEQLGYKCLMGNASYVIHFVKVTLERCVNVLDNTEEVAMGMFESGTVVMAMGLLGAVMDGEIQMSDADRTQSKELLPLLQTVIDSHPDPLMQQLATDLRIAIATHGRLKAHMDTAPSASGMTLDMTGMKQAVQSDKILSGRDQKPNIEVLSESNTSTSESQDTLKSQNSQDVMAKSGDEALQSVIPNDNCDESCGQGSKSLPDSTENSDLRQVLEMLNDAQIPIKGHALIALRRLVERKDTETINKQRQILNIFKEHLCHGDSYIYLAAIQGLASLAGVDTDEVLHVLLEEYTKADDTQSISAELRMKIGEVLVKTSKTLGEMAPKYSNILLRGFLQTAKDSDAHIRASSLSNMAEICQLLRYSLGRDIYEILDCVGSLIHTDSDVGVRRAASMFTHQLFSGLTQDGLQYLADPLRVVYNLLKKTVYSERDDVVLQHAQLALQTLDHIMRTFIFPDQKLEKKLQILSMSNS